MAEKTEETKKVKRPTAKKRNIQSEKRRMLNKGYRAKVSTTIKIFEKELAAAASQNTLSAVFSVVDKGVKKGIIKLNKAARIKSRLNKKMAAAK